VLGKITGHAKHPEGRSIQRDKAVLVFKPALLEEPAIRTQRIRPTPSMERAVRHFIRNLEATAEKT
jgi:hypothetical protein